MAETTGWGTVSLQLPDYLGDVRDAINSVAELLIAFLDIAIAALQLIKAFAIAFLDPIKALVQAIVDMINRLLQDFANLGIYITHDMALTAEGWPFKSLEGGFSEYERRMIARLTDRSDPTRPNLSPDTPVFAGFFYLSVDATSIARLEGFIAQILALFSMKFFPESSLPVPVIDRVDYGSNTVGVFGGLSALGTFDAAPPNKARVTWRVPQPSRSGINNPLSAFSGPTAYIVTVSTVPEGIPLFFDRPEADSGSARRDRGAGAQQQRREQGPCRDETGKPILLYGGADHLRFPASSLGWNNAVQGSKVKDGVARCYGSLRVGDSADQAIIPLESMRDGDKYYWQREFRLEPDDVVSQWANREFSILLDLSDLPNHAEVVMGADGKATIRDLGKPSTYYVRVASVSETLLQTGFAWDFEAAGAVSGQLAGEPFRVSLKGGASQSGISSWSRAQKVTFPTGNTLHFLNAIETALCLLCLGRADLPVIDDLSGTKGADLIAEARRHEVLLKDVALVRTGLEPFKKLIFDMFPDFAQTLSTKNGSAVLFRRELADEARRLASRLRDQSGFSAELEDFVVQNTRNLREATLARILQDVGEVEVARYMGNFAQDTILEHLRGEKLSPSADEVALLEEDLQLLQANFTTDLRNDPDDPSDRIGALEEQINLLRESSPPVGAGNSMGIAPNPYSVGVPVGDMEGVFKTRNAVRLRKPHFIEFDPSGATAGTFTAVAPASEVPRLLRDAPPSIQAVYERYILPDGSLEVPSDVATFVTSLVSTQRVVGSADMSPVLYAGQDALVRIAAAAQPSNDNNAAGILYLRSLFGQYQGGVLYQEAALTLQMTGAAALRSPQDGEWIAIRFFDGFPGVQGFLESIQNWLDALAAAIKSIADTLIAYINFIEARLVELQQLIRRINALIQSVLSFSIVLPQFSGLLMVADGTSGVLRNLVTAEDKPFDSPLAYGAGVGFVMALLPGLVGQFVKNLILTTRGSPDSTKAIDVDTGEDAFGLNGIPEPPPGQGPNDEPDVL